MKQATDQDLFSGVEQAIRTVLNLPRQPILLTTTIVGDLGAESIDFVDIACELEKLVDTEVSFRAIFKARHAKNPDDSLDITVQDIVDYLEARRA